MAFVVSGAFRTGRWGSAGDLWDSVQEGNVEEAAYQAAKLKERLIVDVRFSIQYGNEAGRR